MHPALSRLPQPLLDVLETSVRRKLNAYFEFTKGLQRSVPDLHGQPWFIYPEPSLVSDLLVLAALFGETYQAFDDHAPNGRDDLATVLSSDPDLREDYRRLVEGESAKDPNGSFWVFSGPGQVSTTDAVTTYMKDLVPTIRNGFLHFHWRFENQSAMDYWKAHHWSVAGADPRFNLPSRHVGSRTILPTSRTAAAGTRQSSGP
jgi:hypothetical protein